MKKFDIKNLSISADATIRSAMQAIGRGGLGVAFVLSQDGAIKSILTDGDIRRALLSGFGLKSSIAVIEISHPVIASIEDSMAQISKKFNDTIRIIPVVDHQNKVVDVHFRDKRTHISVTNPFFDDHEIELLTECIVTGWVSSAGAFVTQFENMVANYCGMKYAVSCSSATSGLHLALLAHNIGPGDEVLVPSLTFIATANAVSYTGAKPIFIDSEINTWNINPNLISDAITPRTKAIIPVHLYGHPADMDTINDISNKHNLIVIEDAAEAQGAKYKNRMVGSLADVAVFSFFGNKIITTGEGGMIVTDDAKIAEKCRILRDHGMSKDRRYWHEVIGYNYRLTNMQAALGVAQMGKIDKIISRKKEIAAEYNLYLEGVEGVTLPANADWADNVYWLYTILIDSSISGCEIDELMLELQQQGIDSRPVFPPVHKQPVYDTGLILPIAEKISLYGISLPSAPEIRNKNILKICKIIKDVIEEKKQKKMLLESKKISMS
jgi:perosamine synthetase